MALVQLKTRWLAWPVALGITAFACVALMWSIPSAASAADEAAWMYNPDQVVEINLELTQEKFEELEAEPETYQKGTFELKVNGVPKEPPIPVSIKLKGTVGASFRPLSQKAAFKLKFKTPLFFGLKKMTLNNMVQDPSMIHETLAYETFRAFGVPASRTGYAVVRLNGFNYGLHLNIESLDDAVPMARIFGPENTQHLYEADKPGTDLRPGQAGTFEIQEGSEESISDLEALINAANDHNGDWSDGMSGLADLNEMAKMWAVERYVGQWDGYAGRAWNDTFRPNNYFLHSTPSGLFTMVPWGTDQTWGISPILFPQSPAYLGVHLAFDEPAGGRIFNFCYEDASCKEQYVKALEGIYSGVAGLGLDARAASLAQVLAPYQAEEAAPRREFTAAEIAQGVADTRKYIGERPGELAAYLFPPPKPAPAPSPAKPRHAKIGPTHVHGAVVLTHITAYEPGNAVQRVSALLEGEKLKACKGEREVHRAREFTIRCRLSKEVRSLRHSHRLHLRVRVGFLGDSHESTFRTRGVTLHRHS